jgi:hypothetical protein
VAEDEFTPEQLAEQIRQLRIQDILLSTVTTLGQLAYVKVEAKELDQAKLAIDAIAALLPTLEGTLDDALLRDFRQLLANLRLSFANAVSASGSEPQAPPATAPTAPTAPKPGESGPDRDAAVPESSQESGSGTEPQTPDDETGEGP